MNGAGFVVKIATALTYLLLQSNLGDVVAL
jgi:hypothetical protein